MKYITDTDFMPSVGDIQEDAYQIIYGTLLHRREEMIYDAIIGVCNRYNVECFRKSKIDMWLHIVNEILTKLNTYISHTEKYMIYVPYADLKCSIQRIVQRFTFTQATLENARNLDASQFLEAPIAAYRQSKRIRTITNLPALMLKAVPKLAEKYKITASEMREIIGYELVRRGLLPSEDSSSKINEDKYREILFNERFLNKMPDTSDVDDDVDDDGIKGDMTVGVGFIYYALEHYFSEMKKATSKTTYDRLRKAAPWVIANGLYRPENVIVKKAASGCGAYILLNDERFLNQPHHIEDIISRLENCKLPVPRELKATLNRLNNK